MSINQSRLQHVGRRVCRGWFVLFLALFLTTLIRNAGAQTDTGRIEGSVADATGGVIPGAKITVKNLDQGTIITATSDGTGNFTFSALPRGNYSVEVTASGFDRQTQNLTLQVSQVQAVNFKLNPGTVSTEIVVTDAAPIVDTSTSSVGEVIQGPQVTQLPLNGRNFTTLALLILAVLGTILAIDPSMLGLSAGLFTLGAAVIAWVSQLFLENVERSC